MSEFCGRGRQTFFDDHIYKLRCVVMHKGLLRNIGYYYLYIKTDLRDDNSWNLICGEMEERVGKLPKDCYNFGENSS